MNQTPFTWRANNIWGKQRPVVQFGSSRAVYSLQNEQKIWNFEKKKLQNNTNNTDKLYLIHSITMLVSSVKRRIVLLWVSSAYHLSDWTLKVRLRNFTHSPIVRKLI